MKILTPRSYAWLVYAILWGMVWAYPALTALIEGARAGTAFSWDSVLRAWAGILPFFLLFLLHRLPVRCLFMRHRMRVYVLSVLGMLCLFGLCRYFSGVKAPRVSPVQEHRLPPHRLPHDGKPVPDRDGAGRKGDTADGGPVFSASRPSRPAGHGPAPGGMLNPLLLDLVIATLMLGFDLAISLFSRYQEEQEKARRLEAAHLRHELEHLKAQVNPHFFMNMLNNIHGMVEMDPAKAQVMIMELSKLMRYVLYEGAQQRTLLYELPEDNRGRVILPPLLFISIIENAFKHGISYQSPSFVEIRLYMEKETLRLDCVNSIHRRPGKESGTGGVGLANLRQRLQLLYGNGFRLDITEKDEIYHVNLTIPCEYETDTMHSR